MEDEERRGIKDDPTGRQGQGEGQSLLENDRKYNRLRCFLFGCVILGGLLPLVIGTLLKSYSANPSENMICDPKKVGFQGSIGMTGEYFFAYAQEKNQTNVPLLVYFSKSNGIPTEYLPCIQTNNSVYIKNTNGLNQQGHTLWIHSTNLEPERMHSFISSLLDKAKVDAKREILFIGELDAGLPTIALTALANNFQMHSKTFLNIAGLVLNTPLSSCSGNHTSSVGILLDAGVQVLVASNVACNSSTILQWAKSIPWYGERAFKALNQTHDTCLSSANFQYNCSQGLQRQYHHLRVVHHLNDIHLGRLSQVYFNINQIKL